MYSASLNTSIADRLDLSEVEFVVRADWGAQAPESRLGIRRALVERVGAVPSLLDLSLTPRAEGYGLSISHHRQAGGYLLSAAPAAIGFDMEIIARARPELVARVSKDHEVAAAPSSAALWTAKEAAFKSLFTLDQPLGVADIEIGNWQALSKGQYTCEIVALRGQAALGRSRGLVVPTAEECLAFFRAFPQNSPEAA